MRYLGRYTHRGPIANARLLSLEEGRVRFRYKDYRSGGEWRTADLTAEEFIRRYLLHVLPPGFMRIRYYGLYAHARRRTHLAACRTLLVGCGASGPETEEASAEDETAEGELPSGRRCEVCERGRMVRCSEWHAGERPPLIISAARSWAA